MTAQLDVEALVGELRRIMPTCCSKTCAGPDDPGCEPVGGITGFCCVVRHSLAHIASEDARVAAAVAGERERNLEAQRQAFEAAARVADNHAEPTDTPSEFTAAYELAARKIGRAIRRLLPAAAIRETPSA